MNKIEIITMAIGLLFFTSCSKHIYVNYQTETAHSGKVVLKPSKPTEKTYVTINDNLIIDKKTVKSVTIRNVPNGDYVIHYTSENRWYKEKLNDEIPIKMDNGREITKHVEVPPYSVAYWVCITGPQVLILIISLTR
jgi:uncharacterized protein YcfL